MSDDSGSSEWATAEKNRRAIFAICRAFKLTRADRLEIATNILNRNLDSYKQLHPRELSRLRDAFEGAVQVATIRMERNRGQRV